MVNSTYRNCVPTPVSADTKCGKTEKRQSTVRIEVVPPKANSTSFILNQEPINKPCKSEANCKFHKEESVKSSCKFQLPGPRKPARLVVLMTQ